ncbi:WD domain, G-beta repeat protein [Dictyocaulus viviparus]|uniref:WD domain, G-beta repeat protein n=1 Tax=Dictyocaulus viviparus TaxID=29172 RepID=A0A0D8XTQ1_DICVI|nr:WD domain, G-beta repeat protein [Dictyocaulus viviparus]
MVLIEKEKNSCSLTLHAIHKMPSSLPGGLHPTSVAFRNTKGAIVYGSHNILFIVDAFTFKRVQTVDLHTTAIDRVCWSPPFSICEQARSEDYRIASSDISGQIIISEPITATKKCQFSHAASNVLNMKWFVWKDISRDFLLSLHSGQRLILWNTENGENVWSVAYTTPLFDMALDPFNSRHVAYHSQIYCFHTELFAVLFSTSIEPNHISLLCCASRDAVFSVQATGSVTLRIGNFSNSNERVGAQLGLEKVAVGEVPRQSTQQRAVSAALCPITQNSVAVLFSSGKLLFWQLTSEEVRVLDYRQSFIEDNLVFGKDLNTVPVGNLSIHQTGFLNALSSGVSCLRMRPIDDFAEGDDSSDENTFGSAHLVAVGSHSGVLHLVDVFTCEIIREFIIHSSPITCLEWGGAYTIITSGYSHSLSTAQVVRNDLFATDIRTGTKRRIRPEADESPITLLRVSFYQCYLALAFQREPLEIWDLKGLRLLRRMSKTCPLIVDMAWSCKHHGIKTTEDGGLSIYRENLVVLDSDNRLYHVIVKGLHVKDGKEVNTQLKNGGWSIRTMAWKDDILVMGDAEGRVMIWDLGRRQSRDIRASRFPVVRMRFSRLAGDHTLAILHPRELSLWDTEALTRQLQISLDHSRSALDMDLCGVSPILLTNDNVVRYAPDVAKNSPMLEKDIPFLMNTKKVAQLESDFDLAFSENSAVAKMIERKVSSTSPCKDVVDISGLKNQLLLSKFLGDLYIYQLLSIACFSLSNGETQLSPDLQMFWSNAAFKERELRVTCAACGATNVEESKLVERAVVAGGKAKDLAVDRLISSPDLRYASMKAALLVSSQECEKARSLIKLIATNLIASDMIEDGVELLFLVNAGGDACKYLQSQHQWIKSVIYAKMGLENLEDVLNKWIAHLSYDHKTQYIFAQASQCEWPEVVKVLSNCGHSDLARLILRASTSSPPPSNESSLLHGNNIPID